MGFDGQLGGLPVQFRDMSVGLTCKLDSQLAPSLVGLMINGGSGRIGQHEITSWSVGFTKGIPEGETTGEPPFLAVHITTPGANATIEARIHGLSGPVPWNDLRIDGSLDAFGDLGYWLAQLPATVGMRVSGDRIALQRRLPRILFRTTDGRWNWDARTNPGNLELDSQNRLQARNLNIALPDRAGRVSGIRATLPFEFTADSSHVEVTSTKATLVDVGLADIPSTGVKLTPIKPKGPLLTLEMAETPAKFSAIKGADGRWTWLLAAWHCGRHWRIL